MRNADESAASLIAQKVAGLLNIARMNDLHFLVFLLEIVTLAAAEEAERQRAEQDRKLESAEC